MSIHPMDKECHVVYMMYSDIIGKCMVVHIAHTLTQDKKSLSAHSAHRAM
jgi:hypothetical protein